MIKYVGQGDYTKVDIRIYGDGFTNQIYIDLAKAPFFLDFLPSGKSALADKAQPAPFYPKSLDISDIGGSPQPSSIILQGTTLDVVFDSPPPETDFSKTTAPTPEPKISFTVNFIYGMQITKDAHNQDS